MGDSSVPINLCYSIEKSNLEGIKDGRIKRRS